MVMKQKALFKKYVRGTPAGAIVHDETVLICHLTNAVMEIIGIRAQKVHISSRILKHLYDKKPAEEFECVLEHLHEIVKFPERVYKNKQGKRGHFGLFKTIKNKMYFCSIEIQEGTEKTHKAVIATAFRVRDEAYLKSYELLWSWRDDAPSS